MATSSTPQVTDYTQNVIGHSVCNGLDEALQSADVSAQRPNGISQDNARPFDIIAPGGGSSGSILAQDLFDQGVLTFFIPRFPRKGFGWSP